MTDSPEPQPHVPAQEESAPESWQAQLEQAAGAVPKRRDLFDAARKRTFVKALSKGAALTAAAKAAGVSPRTVYTHQSTDAEFAAACEAAAKISAPAIELAAYERGVVGVEEDVISYGKLVGTRVKRSDALLQTLLKGSNPDKYGPRAGFGKADKKGRKQWLREERARLKEKLRPEVEQEVRAAMFSPENRQERIERIMRRLDRARKLDEAEKVKEGWTLLDDGILIPPGWVRAGSAASCFSCEGREGREGTQANPDAL